MNVGDFVVFTGTVERKRIEDGKTVAVAKPGCVGRIEKIRHSKEVWYAVEFGYPGKGVVSVRASEVMPSTATELPEKTARTRARIPVFEDMIEEKEESAGETDEQSAGDDTSEDYEDQVAE